MQPPRKVSREEFERLIQTHVAANYHESRWGERQIFYCRACGSRIKAELCYVSEHTTAFDNCAEGGRVEHVQIPYCPNCEGKPKPDPDGELRSCVHVGYAPSPQVLESMGIKDPEHET